MVTRKGSAKPKVKKKNGEKQRPDTELTQDIAYALTQLILSGQAIFTAKAEKEGQITLPDGRKLPYPTVNSWVARENVIPETQKPLKELLQEAREEYRKRVREERHKKLLDNAEKNLEEVSKIPAEHKMRDKNDNYRRDEKGRILKTYRSDIMTVKADVAKFVAERLDPENYAQKTQNENKHLVFSLSELRKARDQKREEGQDQ